MQVRAADVAQLDALEIGPDAFVRIQVGRIAWQLLQAQPLGTALRQEGFDWPAAMNRRAVPDHEQLAGQVTQQVAEELHHVRTAERMVLDLEQQAAARGDAADHRQVLTGHRKPQRGRVSARRKAPHHRWQQGEARSSTQTIVRPSRAAPFLELASAPTATVRSPPRYADSRGGAAFADSNQPLAAG